MADEAPLLEKKPVVSINDTIESCIGTTGCCQLLQAVLVALPCAFDSQQTFINVFTDAAPSWHCNDKDDSRCSAVASSCGLPEGTWSWTNNETSIVAEWNLQCSPSAIVSMPTSAYFLGCLVGGLSLATLADSRLGRKNMLVASCFTMSLAAALAALSPNLHYTRDEKLRRGLLRRRSWQLRRRRITVAHAIGSRREGIVKILCYDHATRNAVEYENATRPATLETVAAANT